MAFFRRNYSGLDIVTPAILSEAVTVLGPALDWFDRSPEAMQLRNQPAPPPRKMSEQMKIQAGLTKDPDSVHTHKDDKPLISMQETAHMAKEAFRKEHNLPSDEEQWKVKAEAISVTTKSGSSIIVEPGSFVNLLHMTQPKQKSIGSERSSCAIDWQRKF